MSWNYRVVREKFEISLETYEYGYSIKEVYYDAGGKVDGWSEDIGPWGNSLKELADVLTAMIKACFEPILEEQDGKLIEVQDENKND